MKILHFADAHIDVANAGRHDPESGLPVRVQDFLKSLDTITNTAIDEKADLVIFAGDAYKDRTPAPTFQREWGRRIMRLSDAGIETILLVGNHDLSPSFGRAHTLEEFATFKIPHVHVVSKPQMLTPKDLGLDVQVLALPWVNRSGFITANDSPPDVAKLADEMGLRLEALVEKWLETADPAIPTVLTAHASVQGALQSTGYTVSLGNELVLSQGLVKNPKLDYVALGHIHKAQDLNEGAQPPVIYPGSIEKVDFGEASDNKCFVIADVQKGQTSVDWRKLETRKFIDRKVKLETPEKVTEQILKVLGTQEDLTDAMVRLVMEYPSEMEAVIDERAIRAYTEKALEFNLVKRPVTASRVRLPDGKTAESLTPEELLNLYFDAAHIEVSDTLMEMAKAIMAKEQGYQIVESLAE